MLFIGQYKFIIFLQVYENEFLVRVILLCENRETQKYKKIIKKSSCEQYAVHSSVWIRTLSNGIFENIIHFSLCMYYFV